MLDDVDISIRDLSFWMMCVSDNTATDVLQEIVGTDRVNKTMADLGLGSTFLEGDCNHFLSTLIEDVGGIEKLTPALTADQIAGIRSLNAGQTNRTSPRDAANLLRLIWTDGAASPGGLRRGSTVDGPAGLAAPPFLSLRRRHQGQRQDRDIDWYQERNRSGGVPRRR